LPDSRLGISVAEAGKRIIHMPRFCDVFDRPKIKAVRATTTLRSEILVGELNEICELSKLEAWKAVLLAASKLSPQFTIKGMASSTRMPQRVIRAGVKQLLKKGLIIRDTLRGSLQYSLAKEGAKLAAQLLITMTILKKVPNAQRVRTASKDVVKFELRRGSYLLFFPPAYIEIHAPDKQSIREILIAFRDELFKCGLIS
jgi:predicted transcriptional regulator